MRKLVDLALFNCIIFAFAAVACGVFATLAQIFEPDDFMLWLVLAVLAVGLVYALAGRLHAGLERRRRARLTRPE